MKSIATNRLTRVDLEKPARYHYLAAAGAIIIIIFSLLTMTLRLVNHNTTLVFSEVLYALSTSLGATWAFRTAFLARYGLVRMEKPYQLAWLLIGLGLVTKLAAGLFYALHFSLGDAIFYLLGNVFCNFFYPLTFAGLIIMPASIRFRGRMGLDALISTLSVMGVLCFFVVNPMHFAQIPTTYSWVVILPTLASLAYPCWNVLLLLAILLLVQRGIKPVLHFSLLLFGIAILSHLWGDLAFTYLRVFHSYQPGTLYIDPFWYTSYLLIGLSGLYQYKALVRKESIGVMDHQQESELKKKVAFRQHGKLSLSASKHWRYLSSLLIHLPLTTLLALTAYSELVYHNQISQSLVLLTAVVGTLVSLRYLLAMHDNRVLLQEREAQHEESEQLRYMMTLLTEILDEEHLRESIVGMVADELGFDAVMLLLIDEQAPDLAQAQLQAYMTTAPSTDGQHWCFQGANLLQEIAHGGIVREVSWEDQIHVPPEVRLWQLEKQIPTMVFLPLLYQERILGCLGVMRRDRVRLSRRDVSLVMAYTEQITTVLEHARLYKEAREHEGFSRAMTTITTRLNAAVIEPAEISLVICKEGANLLHADYAIFYSKSEDKQLVPLAAYMQGLDTALPLHEWPSLQTYEYEAQALYAAQPTLLHIPVQEMARSQGLPLFALPMLEHESRSPRLPMMRERLRSHPPSLRVRLAQYYIQTAILAPVVAKGEPVGLLIFARSQPPGPFEKPPFTAEDLPQTQDFVEQAAVAFTNAQLYQHVQKAHQRLQELDQMKDQFMATASHELRTPLTAVQGYIELLAQFGEQLPSEQRREFLQKAQHGCDELVVLLGNVMDASRIDAEAIIRPALLKRVSVKEMIDSVLVLIEPQLTQQQRRVHLHIPQHLFVMADPMRLRQVLMNISVNALKYSPARTPLAFFVHPTIDQQQQCVVISVADKGKGITPEDQAQLFQRFVRLEGDVNSPVRGSGLGLYISRRLIHAMRGKIWIESKGIPGEGSTFHIQLPVAE